MSGLELFSLAEVGPGLGKPLKGSGSSVCSENEIDLEYGFRPGRRESEVEDFGSRLEAALAAVRLEQPATAGGNPLPIPALETQCLGESTCLITAANAESTTEEALFALALSQGLDPEVVAGVLWPGQQGPTPGPPGALSAPGSRTGDSSLLTRTDSGLFRAPGASTLSGLMSDLKPVPLDLLVAPQAGGGRPVALSGGSTPAAGGERSATGPVAFFEGSIASAVAVLAASDRPSRTPGVVIAGGSTATPAAQWGAGAANAVATSIVGGQTMPLPDPFAAQALQVSRRERVGHGAAAMPDGVADGDLMIRGVSQPGDRSALSSLAPPAAEWMSRQFRSESINQPVGMLSSQALPLPIRAAGQEELLAGDPVSDPSSPGVEPLPAHSAARTGALDLSELQEGLERAGRTEADRELARQRMSEALATRMIAQVNRGHWSMQLELKPADLGSIAVEMSLHNGRLEALFDAPNPAARALIAEGLERLRQDLERSGMNVAQLGMQQFAGGSGGGKPTAGRFERRAESGADEALQSTDTAAAANGAGKASDRTLDIRV